MHLHLCTSAPPAPRLHDHLCNCTILTSAEPLLNLSTSAPLLNLCSCRRTSAEPLHLLRLHLYNDICSAPTLLNHCTLSEPLNICTSASLQVRTSAALHPFTSASPQQNLCISAPGAPLHTVPPLYLVVYNWSAPPLHHLCTITSVEPQHLFSTSARPLNLCTYSSANAQSPALHHLCQMSAPIQYLSTSAPPLHPLSTSAESLQNICNPCTCTSTTTSALQQLC